VPHTSGCNVSPGKCGPVLACRVPGMGHKRDRVRVPVPGLRCHRGRHVWDRQLGARHRAAAGAVYNPRGGASGRHRQRHHHPHPGRVHAAARAPGGLHLRGGNRPRRARHLIGGPGPAGGPLGLGHPGLGPGQHPGGHHPGVRARASRPRCGRRLGRAPGVRAPVAHPRAGPLHPGPHGHPGGNRARPGGRHFVWERVRGHGTHPRPAPL
jgi:hypothetical protein